MTPQQKKKFGNFIPISQIVKPRHEERVAIHMRKIMAEEEAARAQLDMTKTPTRNGELSQNSPLKTTPGNTLQQSAERRSTGTRFTAQEVKFADK